MLGYSCVPVSCGYQPPRKELWSHSHSAVTSEWSREPRDGSNSHFVLHLLQNMPAISIQQAFPRYSKNIRKITFAKRYAKISVSEMSSLNPTNRPLFPPHLLLWSLRRTLGLRVPDLSLCTNPLEKHPKVSRGKRSRILGSIHIDFSQFQFKICVCGQGNRTTLQ